VEFLSTGIPTGWLTAFLVLAGAAWLLLRGKTRRIVAAAALAIVAPLAGAVLWYLPQGEPASNAEQKATQEVQEVRVRPAEANQREAAEAAIREAEALLNFGDTDAARLEFEQARRTFANIGGISGQGDAAFGLARLAHVSGQSDRAREHFSEALALYREAGALAEEAWVLVALGDLEKDTFNWGAARDNYRKGRSVWSGLASQPAHEHVLLRLDQLRDFPAGEAAARSDLAQARLLYANLDDPVGLGDVNLIEGQLEFNLGDFDTAWTQFGKAVLAYRGEGDTGAEADATSWVARAEVGRGHNVAASDAVTEAERLYVKIGSETGLAQSALIRGDIERIQGRVSQALQHYRQAATRLGTLLHRRESEAWLKSGQMERENGDLAAANDALNKALGLFAEAADGRRGMAEALYSLGIVALARGGLEEATQFLTKAGELYAGVGNQVAFGRALLQLGRVKIELSDLESARQFIVDGAAALEAAGQQFGAVIAHLTLGELERAAGNTDVASTAFAAARTALDRIEEPILEANLYLGRPPVQRIDLVGMARSRDYHLGAPPPPTEQQIEHESKREENWIVFPNQNFEARRLADAVVRTLVEAGF
jgi:tetratricopeptide (TPR) repeat protein